MEHRVDYLDLDEVTPAIRNPKHHDTEGIARSISHHGVAELPLLDERTGRLIAGHGRLTDLRTRRAAGGTPPAGVKVDDTGRWLVPVVRGWSSRSDEDAEAYLVASNHLTTKGGWDDEALGQILADLNEADPALLELTGFDEDDLAALLGDDEDDDGPSGGGDGDNAPEPPDTPVSVPGDVWLLGGRHRLMCGDALNPDDLDKALAGLTPGIVYTDPPYGISIVSGNGDDLGKVGGGGPFGGMKNKGAKVIQSSHYLPVAGDGTTDAAADAFRLLSTSFPEAKHIWWGGNHYASSAGLPDTSCWLVWDKENTGNFADAELAWTNHPGAVRLLRHMWNGMLRASERGKRVHPTQKPVALATWAFGVVDPKHEQTVVLDVFGGSGSTLIAAHESDRTAVILELEPSYVDVIARRYQQLTDDLPVLESTGEAHDFIGGDPGE